MACRKDMKPKWNSTPAHRGSFPPPPPVRKGKHRPPDCFSPPAAKKQQKDEPQNWGKSPPTKQPLKVKVATKEAPSSPQPFSLLPRDPMDPFEKVRRWNDAGGDPRYLSLGSMGSLVACPSCGPDTVPLAPIEPRVSTRRDTMMHADVIGDFAGAEEAPPPLPHEVTLGISSLKKLMKGETHWEGRMSEEIEFCKVSSGSANSPKEVHTISPMSIEELPGPDPPAPAHPFGGAQAPGPAPAPPPPPALASAPAPAPVVVQTYAQAPAPSLSAPFVAAAPAEGLVPPAMPTFSKRAVCRHPHEVLVHTPVFLILPMDPPPAAGPPCQNPPSPLAPALVLPPPPPPAPVEPVKPVEPAPVPPPSPLPAPASPAVPLVPASPVPGPAPEAQVAEVEALENGQPQSEPQPEPEPEPEPVAVPGPRPSSPVFVPPLSQGSSSRMSSQCLSQLEAGPKEDAKPDHITIRQRRLGQRPMRELKEYVQRSGIEVEAFKGKSDLVKKLADRSEEELPFFQDLFPPEAGKEVLALKWNRRLSLFCNFGE